MRKIRTCSKCGMKNCQDEQGIWFCPDCIIDELDPAFLDEQQNDPGDLIQPYLFSPPPFRRTVS
jgi:hypothetical protein